MSLVRYDSGPQSGSNTFNQSDFQPFDKTIPRKRRFIGDSKFANETRSFLMSLCGQPEQANVLPEMSEMSTIAHGMEAIAASKPGIRQEDMSFLLAHLSKFVPGRSPVEVAEMWREVASGKADLECGHVPQVASFRFNERFKFSVAEDTIVCLSGFCTIVMVNLVSGREQRFEIEGVVDVVCCDGETAFCVAGDQVLRLVMGVSEPQYVKKVKAGFEKIVCNSSIDPFFALVGCGRLAVEQQFGRVEESINGEVIAMEVRGNRLFAVTQKEIIVVDDMRDMTTFEADMDAFCVNWNGSVMVGCKGDQMTLYEVDNDAVWSVETVTCQFAVKSCTLSDAGVLAVSDGKSILLYHLRDMRNPVDQVWRTSDTEQLLFDWIPDLPLLVAAGASEMRIYHVGEDRVVRLVYTKRLQSQTVSRLVCTQNMIIIEFRHSVEIIRFNSRAIPQINL